MKTLKLILASVAALFAANGATAVTFVDVDVDGNEGEPHYQYLSAWGNNTWSANFNILAAGFNPSTMEILSAVVYFAFADDNGDEGEYVTATVGQDQVLSNAEVDGSHTYGYDWRSANLGDAELQDLEDGSLDYEVTVNSGDTYLKEAKLVVTTGPKASSTQVPDAGKTFVLLVLGVGILAVLKRQMADAVV